MDEITRQIVAEAFALDDETNADHAEWEASRAQPQSEMICKTFEQPAPQQQSVATKTATWNEWFAESFRNHIDCELDAFWKDIDDAIVGNVIREVCEKNVDAHRKLRDEIASLRAEIEVLRGRIEGNVTPIGHKNVA